MCRRGWEIPNKVGFVTVWRCSLSQVTRTSHWSLLQIMSLPGSSSLVTWNKLLITTQIYWGVSCVTFILNWTVIKRAQVCVSGYTGKRNLRQGEEGDGGRWLRAGWTSPAGIKWGGETPAALISHQQRWPFAPQCRGGRFASASRPAVALAQRGCQHPGNPVS